MARPTKKIILRLSGRKLKTAIERRGIKQIELARQMGIPRQVVSKWVHGGLSTISVDTLATLCEILKVEQMDIMIRIQ